MALSIFKAFNSTVTSFVIRKMSAIDEWLADPTTGAIVGIRNPNANGPDARFVPVDLTAAQINAPTAAMIADLDAVYRLSIAPYTRYVSNGTTLVEMGGGDPYHVYPTQQTIPPGAGPQLIPIGAYFDVYSPWTIQNPDGVTVQGSAYVTTRPA